MGSWLERASRANTDEEAGERHQPGVFMGTKGRIDKINIVSHNCSCRATIFSKPRPPRPPQAIQGANLWQHLQHAMKGIGYLKIYIQHLATHRQDYFNDEFNFRKKDIECSENVILGSLLWKHDGHTVAIASCRPMNRAQAASDDHVLCTCMQSKHRRGHEDCLFNHPGVLHLVFHVWNANFVFVKCWWSPTNAWRLTRSAITKENPFQLSYPSALPNVRATGALANTEASHS